MRKRLVSFGVCRFFSYLFALAKKNQKIVADFSPFLAVRRAVMGMLAANRIRDAGATVGGGQTDKEKEDLKREVERMKSEAENVSDKHCDQDRAYVPWLRGAN